MKKAIVGLFWKTFLFTLPIFLVWGYLEFKLSQIPNGYSIKHKMLIEHAAQTEVLVLGSSHAHNGINPAIFTEKGLNLAYRSQSLYFDIELLKKFLGKMPDLKVVLFEISTHTLWTSLENSTAYWRSFFYLKHFGIPSKLTEALDMRKYSYIALYGPRTCLKMAFRGFAPFEDEPMNELGFSLFDSTDYSNLNPKTGKIRMQFHEELCKTSFLKANIRHMGEVLKLLKSENINAVFIRAPAYHTYTDNLNLDRDKINLFLLDSLGSTTDTKFFDYFKDPRFNKFDFKDNDHLNITGAEKFSAIIKAEILVHN